MADLKRDLIKYCRDRAKSKYNKGSECEICTSTNELEFHHFNSMTQMLDKWLAKNKLKVETAEEIMSVRDSFIEEHQTEIYDLTTTLCKQCHLKLHAIYGKKPSLGTAAKQERWVQRQRDKYREKHGLV